MTRAAVDVVDPSGDSTRTAYPPWVNLLNSATPAERFRSFVAPALAVIAATLWAVGLHPITPSQLGGTGLFPALSPILVISYPVLVAAVVFELAGPRPRTWLLGAMTCLGVALVYGLQPAVEQTARMTVSWLHVGFADYIANHGHTLLGFDGRFSWPGFFSAIAFLTKASGSHDATPLIQWAPMVFAGLNTLGMRAIAVSVMGPGRAAWFATWLFLLAQWTEQDYFSPQATTYVLMLAALALTTRFLVRPGLAGIARRRGTSVVAPAHSVGERLGAQALVVLLAIALAPSHQLTSFMLAGFLVLMAWFGRLWPRWLPWLVLVPALVWFSLGARDFWQGQLHMVIGEAGDIFSSVDQSVGGRFVGDSARTVILLLRVGLTAGVGALALFGWWSRWRRGASSAVLVILAAAPMAMIGVQSYGGEVAVRCFLFALPFAAMLGAFGLERLLGTKTTPGIAGAPQLRRYDHTPYSRPWRTRVIAVAVILSAFGLSTVVTRGGNDAYTSFSRADVATVEAAYRLATPGQTISALSSDPTPLGFARIGEVTQSSVESKCPDLADVANCVLTLAPTYLVVTPTQDNYGQIFYGKPRGWTVQMTTTLVDSGRYRIVFQDNGSRLLAANARVN
jgi:hypothetical protein